MLLVITCTEDVTTNMLMPFLDGVNVFRFNINKWNEYIWDFSDKGFKVLSPDGNLLTSNNIKCVYLRKPLFLEDIDIPKEGCLDNWLRSEVECLWKDVYYDMANRGKTILVHPRNGWRKHTQMTIAK